MTTLGQVWHVCIRADQWSAAQDLASLRSQSPVTVLDQAVRIHIHGRLAVEIFRQAKREATQLLQTSNAPPAICFESTLTSEILALSASLKQSSSFVCEAAIDHYLFGELGELAVNTERLDLRLEWQTDEESLSVWIPDRVLGALDALCAHLDLNRSDVVRNALFSGLFGRLSLERAIRCGWWKVSRRNAVDIETIQFSEQSLSDGEVAAARTAFVAHFGKSVESVKVWLPRPLKLALLDLADRRAIRLSELTRRMLCVALLGRL